VNLKNALPKARVFHLQDKSGMSLLENPLVPSRKKSALADRPNESELADKLETLGEHIDRESFKITGGLLIIGGAVAFANPIIGAGLAAKALFPSLGPKASKLGLNFAGKKLRDRSEKSQVRQAKKAARAEVQQLKPELYLNPLLQDLEQAVSALTIRSSQSSPSWRTSLTPAISASPSKPSSPFMRKSSEPSPPQKIARTPRGRFEVV
jgi:hypothetical protein